MPPVTAGPLALFVRHVRCVTMVSFRRVQGWLKVLVALICVMM